MKHSMIKVCVYLFAMALFGLMSGCKEQSAVFQVNDVISDPGAYSQPLTVEGVVYAHAQDDATIVGVMDKKELQCTTPNCNKALLAVKISGQMPAVGDEIRASGSFAKERWGYVLQADAVQVITRHKLGG